jgi:hypothetical protein
VANDYYFVTRWRVAGRGDEVYALISRPLDYPRWWPSVYLETEEIDPGDASGLGRRTRFLTKGWLPYTLRWQSRAIEINRPHRLTIEATGDFDGRGIWMIEQHGAFVNMTFDWKLRADKPLLRYLSFLLKPAFAANHRWAMEQGRKSLELEIARRHAKAPQEAARIPAPPGPNTTSGVWLAAGTVVIFGGLGVLLWAVLRLF